MDQFQQELAALARMASIGGSNPDQEQANPLFNILNPGTNNPQ